MTKRHVSPPDGAAADAREFIDAVDERLAAGTNAANAANVARDVLLALSGETAAWEAWRAGEPTPPGERARLRSYDPRNATIESEYYAEAATQPAFAESKALQWLWRGFDATPAAGNVAFALAFREMLAGHLFAEAGENLRLFSGITMTYGHNIELGDNVVVHDDVHLDDRGRLTVGDRVSLSDGVHLYSHEHGLVDQTAVDNYHTAVADDARVAYDAMVRAGSRVGRNAILGARAVLNGDVPDHHVAVGAPARSVKVKPGWESAAEPVDDGRLSDRSDERRVEHGLPGEFDEFDEFDEFGRDLDPPGEGGDGGESAGDGNGTGSDGAVDPS